MAKGIYVGADNFTKRTLPSGYTQVEYIQSTGTQYINTGFNPKYNTRILMEASGLVTGSTGQWLFGARNGTNSTTANQFCLYRTPNQTFRADYFGTNTTLSLTDASGRTVYERNANVVNCHGLTVVNTAVTSGTVSIPLYILTLNNNGTAHANGAQVKLYSCKIYDGVTLVRDFVPCTNSSGTVGLYDLAGGSFYTNAGTGSFTVGDTYKTGVARKVKNVYVGIDNLARRVKKVYVGVGGVARLSYNADPLAYYGTATALSAGRARMGATTIGNYALFAGGDASTSLYFTNVDAYNTSLTRSTPTSALSAAKSSLAAASIGNYAIFAGGYNGTSTFSTVESYDTSLTKTSVKYALKAHQEGLQATTIGSYALFGGGAAGTTYSTNMCAYNASLTQSSVTALSSCMYYGAATTVGDYALFGGGYKGSYNAVVNAYNASLTRSIPTALSSARRFIMATTVNGQALFAGGESGDVIYDTIDVYNTSLTRSTPVTLSTALYRGDATTVGDCAIVAGGYGNGDYLAVANIFDKNLTRGVATPLSLGRYSLSALNVGNYALFAGGYRKDADGTKTYADIVDVYVAAS